MRSSAPLSSAKAGDSNAVEANATMRSKRFILIYLEPSIENLPGKTHLGNINMGKLNLAPVNRAQELRILAPFWLNLYEKREEHGTAHELLDLKPRLRADLLE